MERKTVDGIVTGVDEEKGTVTAIFAVMGNIDQGGDRIWPGAFTKTFAERGHKVRVLDHHNTFSVRDAIAKTVRLRELGYDELPDKLVARYPDAVGGAEIMARFYPEEDEGSKAVYWRLKEELVSEWSFGYDALQVDFSTEQVAGKEMQVRNLRQVRLWEVSPVLFGMNDATMTTGVKAVSPKRDFPIGPRDRDWDASAAADRWRAASGSEDEPSEQYKNGFMYYQADDRDQFTAYKLPFVDVINGTATAIPRAIFAIAQRLEQTDLPSDDYDEVRQAVSFYYGRMREQFDDESIVPPWEKAGGGPGEGKPYDAFQEDGQWCVYKVDATGNRTGESLGCHDTEAQANAQVRALYAAEGDENSELDDIAEMLIMELRAAARDVKWHKKEGRVLSTANANRITGALTALLEVLEAAGIDIPGYGEDETPDEGDKERDHDRADADASPIGKADVLDWVNAMKAGLDN